MHETAQTRPDAVLSIWPVNCPAYTPAVRKLLRRPYKQKTLRADLKHKLLMCIHARLSKRLGAHTHGVPSTLAQLCWQRRQK